MKVGERKDRPSAAAVGGQVMTTVAVQSVAPAKGMKACACGNTSTGGIAAAADYVGATSLAAVARTAPCALVISSST